MLLVGVMGWWVGADGTIPLSHPQAEKLEPVAVQEDLTDNQAISSPLTHGSLDSSPYPFVPGPSTCLVPQLSTVLPMAYNWVSQLPNLRGSGEVWTCSPISEESFIALPPVLLCPRKAIRWPFRPRINGEAQRKAAATLSTLCMCLCPLLLNTSRPCWVFCPWKAITAFSKCTWGKGTFYPSETKGILHTTWSTVCFWLPPLLPRSTTAHPDLLQQIAQTFKHSEFHLHCLQNLGIFSSSQSSHQWFWGNAFLM